MRRALVVVNPIAGPGRTRTLSACVDLAKSVLAAHDFEADVRVTAGPQDAYRFSSEAAAANVDLVVAWGGDGTINGAASGIAGTQIPFAIVPGGSGNGLARDLLVPFNPTAALTVAATGMTRTIDAGDLHGSLFFNVAGVGFDARIAGRLAEPGARRGLIGYIFATVSELRGYEPGRYSIDDVYDVDGKALAADITDRPALFIALANSRQYGNGAQIAPRALLDDGMIEIVVVEPQSGFSIMRQVPAFFRGTLKEGPGLLMRSAAAMEISCAHPIHFHVDGEPRTGPNRIRLQTRRAALSVKVSR
jgi:diacylglycerol kinase (ATP)